jgi:acyl-CoA dehydrogenase
VHKTALAREVLAGYKPASGLFPTTHLPRLAAEARSRYADVMAELHSEEV